MATGRKVYLVKKRVTIEYTWRVSSEHLVTKAAAQRLALDLGEINADEVTTIRETVTCAESIA